ncbi:PorP/SprF family type IX secretion system membrane protein [Bacteroidota bacterium]
MKRVFICLIVLIGFKCMVLGQFNPSISDYYLTNPALMNPAYSGIGDLYKYSLNFHNKIHNNGFSVPINNQVLNLNANLGRSPGLGPGHTVPTKWGSYGFGATLYNFKLGPLKTTGFQFTFAYHIPLLFPGIPLLSNSFLSFGLSAGGYQCGLNVNDLVFYEKNDPVINSNLLNYFVPDANFGLLLKSDYFFVGFSFLNMMEVIAPIDQAGKNSMFDYWKYNFSGGLNIYIEKPKLTIQPSIAFKTEKSPILKQTLVSGELEYLEYYERRTDLNIKVSYREMVFIGGSYMIYSGLQGSSSFSAYVGYNDIKISQENDGGFNLAYVFNYNLSNYGALTSGTHEIMLGYNIQNIKWNRAKLRKQ